MTARPIPTSAFADDAAQPTVWAWTGRIPLEAVTSIQGDGAAGKSTFMRWLAARASRGELVGDLDGPSNVLWLNIEEHVRRDIRPGLDRQGADVSRIFRPSDRAPVLRLPLHLDRLHKTVVALHVRLVVIDQISGFLATGREDSIRAAITGLRELAEDCGCAIVLTRNLNGNRGADAYRRGRGGGLINDICRASFHFGLHPDDGNDSDGRRVLASIKPQLYGRATRALVVSLDATGRVVIGEEIDLLPSALLARQFAGREQRPEQIELAVALLRELLDGREVPTVEVQAAAGERGISQRTLDRARSQLGVLHRRVARRNPDGSTTQQTLLRLPGLAVPEDPPPDTTPPSSSGTPIAPPAPPPAVDDAKLRFSLLEFDDDGDGDCDGRVGRPDKPPKINGESTTLPTQPRSHATDAAVASDTGERM